MAIRLTGLAPGRRPADYRYVRRTIAMSGGLSLCPESTLTTTVLGARFSASGNSLTLAGARP
jgi:hypothetical protein